VARRIACLTERFLSSAEFKGWYSTSRRSHAPCSCFCHELGVHMVDSLDGRHSRRMFLLFLCPAATEAEGLTFVHRN
jgi:hypothetical protein